jgi:hypothetical protein
VDAWLKEKHGWSLAGWIGAFIKTTLQLDNASEEIIAMDLEDRLGLPRSEMAMNINAMLLRLGKPIHQFDENNRIVVLKRSGKCPRCGSVQNLFIGELVLGGKAQSVGCNDCLKQDGYLPRLSLT